MATREDPPDLRERIAAAVNDDGPLDDIAALGAAQLVLPHQATLEPVSPKWNPYRRLSSLLWRLKFGDDRRSAGPEASALFAWILRRHPMFKGYGCVPECTTLRRFAGRVISEWVMDRCPDCGGTSLKNPEKGDEIARNAFRTKRCETCQQHPGLARIDHNARMRAIEWPERAYRNYWGRRFDWAHALLREIEPSICGPLQSQSRKRSIPRIRSGAHAAGETGH
jgi:hypothetical protein